MSTQAVLFDVPGPRARRTYRIVGVLAVLALLGLLALVVRGLADPNDNQFTADKWRPFLDPVTWTILAGFTALYAVRVFSLRAA